VPGGGLGLEGFLFSRVFADVLPKYTFCLDLSLSLVCLSVFVSFMFDFYYILLFFSIFFPLFHLVSACVSVCGWVGVSRFRSGTHAQTVHRIPWLEAGQYPARRTRPRSHLGSGIGVRFLQEEATRQCVSDFYSYFFTPFTSSRNMPTDA